MYTLPSSSSHSSHLLPRSSSHLLSPQPMLKPCSTLLSQPLRNPSFPQSSITAFSPPSVATQPSYNKPSCTQPSSVFLQRPAYSSSQPSFPNPSTAFKPSQPIINQSFRPRYSQPAFPQNSAINHKLQNRQSLPSQLHTSRQGSAWSQFRSSQVRHFKSQCQEIQPRIKLYSESSFYIPPNRIIFLFC